MSNDNKNNKSLVEDEAFIESLYDKLPDEPAPMALDQRILAAAHREVSSKPQMVKKRPAWLKPMASAATVLLVVTVSVHQILDPAAPLQSSSAPFDTSFDDAVLSDGSLYVDTLDFDSNRETMSGAVITEQEVLLDETVGQAAKPMDLKQSAPAPAALKLEETRAKSQQKKIMPKKKRRLQQSPYDKQVSKGRQTPLSKLKMTDAMGSLQSKESPRKNDFSLERGEMYRQRVAPLSMQESTIESDEHSTEEVAELSVEEEKVSEETIPQLTEDKYRLFVSQNVKWMFVEEDEKNYLIKIIRQDDSFYFYVNKSLFIPQAVKNRQLLNVSKVYPIVDVKLMNQQN